MFLMKLSSESQPASVPLALPVWFQEEPQQLATLALAEPVAHLSSVPPCRALRKFNLVSETIE